MGDRMTCPACNAHTSSVLLRFRDGDPCPYCGLSATAMEEILDIRAKKANEEVTKAYEELMVRLDKAEREAGHARRKLAAIKHALEAEEGEFW